MKTGGVVLIVVVIILVLLVIKTGTHDERVDMEKAQDLAYEKPGNNAATAKKIAAERVISTKCWEEMVNYCDKEIQCCILRSNTSGADMNIADASNKQHMRDFLRWQETKHIALCHESALKFATAVVDPNGSHIVPRGQLMGRCQQWGFAHGMRRSFEAAQDHSVLRLAVTLPSDIREKASAFYQEGLSDGDKVDINDAMEFITKNTPSGGTVTPMSLSPRSQDDADQQQGDQPEDQSRDQSRPSKRSTLEMCEKSAREHQKYVAMRVQSIVRFWKLLRHDLLYPVPNGGQLCGFALKTPIEGITPPFQVGVGGATTVLYSISPYLPMNDSVDINGKQLLNVPWTSKADADDLAQTSIVAAFDIPSMSVVSVKDICHHYISGKCSSSMLIAPWIDKSSINHNRSVLRDGKFIHDGNINVGQMGATDIYVAIDRSGKKFTCRELSWLSSDEQKGLKEIATSGVLKRTVSPGENYYDEDKCECVRGDEL